MDRITAKGYVSLKIDDPDRTRFSDATYNNALDLSQQQFAIDARSIIKETTLTAVTAQQEYALPSDFLVSVLVRHKGLQLTPTTKLGLSFQSGQDWTALANGTPVMAYIDEQDNKLGVVPAPDAGAAGANIVLNYVAIPSTLTSDTQVLLNADTILQYYAPAVVAWAAREMLTYVPQTPEILVKRTELMKDYERYKNQAISTYNNMIDESFRMKGGQHWQTQNTKSKSNAFTG